MPRPTQTSVPLGLILLVASALFPLHVLADTSGSPITGFAWSDNIGWISLNCSSDPGGCSGPAGAWGLSVNPDGTVSGYAWSDNIGWISANAAEVAGCPFSPCTPTISHDVLAGWLRALSATGNGWDGWISLSGSGYGPTLGNGSFSGYAWGSNVVGWIDWSLAATEYETCTPIYSCSGDTIQYTDSSCLVSNVATCISPQFCESGSSSCLAPAITFEQSGSYSGTLQLLPAIVPAGGTTQVHWSVENAQSCTVTGTNGDSWSGLSSPPSGKTSGPIDSQTIYTLLCSAYDNNPNVTETGTVNVVPEFREL